MGPGQGAQDVVWQRGALRDAFPSFLFPGQQHWPPKEEPPAEEPVETGQPMSVEAAWACWESGAPGGLRSSCLGTS